MQNASLQHAEIPIGISDFAEIRDNGYYYIDKTGLIGRLLETAATKATLITRPRRFGKTMAMSMLAAFFDIKQDSRSRFAGLQITENSALCAAWMNQWPTLFLTFKNVDGLTFESAYEMLANEISKICKAHAYLLQSEKVDADDRRIFLRLKAGEGSRTDVKNAVDTLMRMMQAYYGKPVILLLDEYDVPIAKAADSGYYSQMLEIVKAMLVTSIKDNPCLRLAVITGCLKIAKESIFTGTNNFVTDTISDNRYDEFFGFTEEEVKQLLHDTGCMDQLPQIRIWYDGYHFGDIDVYCPWNVLNYVKQKRTTGSVQPQNYWEHTSDNSIIRSFLERTDFDVTEKFETLLKGGCIREAVDENLTYDFLTSSESNLWSLLYSTGYLTKARPAAPSAPESDESRLTALQIPNAEVMEIFRKSVLEWFRDKTARSDRHELFDALWNGDADRLTRLLSDLLFDTISYHDYAESFYHAFLTGLVSGAGYVVESNYESGLGRPDLVIKDRRNRRAIVIEAKTTDSSSGMETACQSALRQIREKEYAKKIERDGFQTVLAYGVAFFRKECLVCSCASEQIG